MRNATLKDVAARAGVSTATVSRVLHESGYVSADARERVEAAVRESGYRLNTVAQELRRQRTIALGLIMHGLSNPYYAGVVAGAEHAAAEQDFNVLLFNARGEPERELRNVETLLRRRVDGILFAGSLGSESVGCAVDAGVAVVEMNHRFDERTSAILIDDYAAARKGVECLLALGHREIAFFGGPWTALKPRSPHPLERLTHSRFEAYRDALAAAGIPLREALLVHGDYPHTEGGWDSQTGADAMACLLDQAPELTAAFAASDLAATGALQTLHRRGLRVPDDVSIVGFDDTYAPHLTPPLTSVRHPPFEMGFQATTMAIELVAGGARRTRSMPFELVVRESTAPPRTSGGTAR